MTGRRLHPVAHRALPPASGGAPASAPLLRVLLGRRLRHTRTARGLTLRDVAAVADVSVGHLSQVERGLCEVSSEVLAAICRALGLPLAALLRGVVVDLTAPVAAAQPVEEVSGVRALTSRTTRTTSVAPGRRLPSGHAHARAA